MRISDWSSDVCSSDLSLDRQRLVIHQNRSDRHAASLVGSSSWNGISMSTPNPPPRFDRVSKRWSGPNACASLSLILASPTPAERLGRVFVSRNHGPVSVTELCPLSPASTPWTKISASLSLGVTASLLAFSTTGCRRRDREGRGWGTE